MSGLLTVDEVARYLKLDPVTVRRKAAGGEIPAIKLGRRFRFDKDEINSWLHKCKVGGKRHVLVVDDEPLVGKLFKSTLEKLGYQVTTTMSSFEALERLTREHFDLIFLDLKMPELDGSELFRHIREKNHSARVAIITGYPESELMVKAIQYGPFVVMRKPISSTDILTALATFIKD
ncbi:MAG TPA: response regulator [Dehalococcoidia bacterium]|nr:response regulator [Dehalococcoidia bacterium]